MRSLELESREITKPELVASSLSLLALSQYVQSEADLAEYSNSLKRKWAKSRVRDLGRYATLALERVFHDEREPIDPTMIGVPQEHDQAMVKRGAGLLIDGVVEVDGLLDTRMMRAMPQAINIAESEKFSHELQAIVDGEKSTSII